jgi:hypothetical protein
VLGLGRAGEPVAPRLGDAPAAPIPTTSNPERSVTSLGSASLMALKRTLARYRFLLDFHLVSRRAQITLCGGMPRSGSTWLFNAARILMLGPDPEQVRLGSGWVDDWRSIPKLPRMLVKTHTFDEFLVARSRHVLYSFRDLRDAIASARRMFGTQPSLDLAREWIQADHQWRGTASLVMRYETMLADPALVIAELARVLAVDDVTPHEVALQLDTLAHPGVVGSGEGYDSTTLLHRGHITDGRSGSWANDLDPQFVRQMETEFEDWFRRNGYATTQERSRDR